MKREVYRSPWFDLEGYLARSVIYSDGSRRTVLRHREVVEEKLGRRLLPAEIVHHKDGNKQNNKLRNLEITTRSGHAKHHAKKPEMIKLVCRLCKKSFVRLARWERHSRNQSKTGPFCGKSCAGRWSRSLQPRNLRRAGTQIGKAT